MILYGLQQPDAGFFLPKNKLINSIKRKTFSSILKIQDINIISKIYLKNKKKGSIIASFWKVIYQKLFVQIDFLMFPNQPHLPHKFTSPISSTFPSYPQFRIYVGKILSFLPFLPSSLSLFPSLNNKSNRLQDSISYIYI